MRSNNNNNRRGRARRRFNRNVKSNKSGRESFYYPKQTDIEKHRDTISMALIQGRGKVLRIPRLIWTPDCMIVDLVYTDTANLTKVNVGAKYWSYAYRANSVYDPDPALGSAAVPGYTYYTGAYQNYRVLQFGYSVTICNKEAFPMSVIVVPTNDNLGGNYASIGELCGMPYATVGMCSSKGGQDRIVLKGLIDLGTFVGNVTQYLGDDGFEGPVGGNPSFPLYVNVGGFCSTNMTTGTGVDVRVNITYTTLWSNRKSVVS